MEPQVIGFDSLVIPTGATTGERIEINVGNSGLINIYNSSNQLTASIGGPNGTILALNNTDNVFVELFDGLVYMGQIVGGVPDTTNAATIGAISGDAGALFLQSGLDPTAPNQTFDQAQLTLISGANNQKTGSATTPIAVFADNNGSSEMDIYLTGSAINSRAGAWQQPILGAGWATSAIRTGEPLQYRLDVENNVVFSGSLNTTSATPANPIFNAVTQSGTDYAPVHNQTYLGLHQNSGGSIIGICTAFYTTSGAFEVFGAGTIASGDIFTFNGDIVIGNIP